MLELYFYGFNGGEKSELNRTPIWTADWLMGLQPTGGTTPVLPNIILLQIK